MIEDLPTMTEPSSPALMAIWRAGVDRAFRTMSTPCFWSSLSAHPLERLSERVLAAAELQRQVMSEFGGSTDLPWTA